MGIKIIATTLICYARLTQTLNWSRTGKSPFLKFICPDFWTDLNDCRQRLLFACQPTQREWSLCLKGTRSLALETEGKIWSNKKIQFFDLLDCERMTWVLSPVRAMACAIHSLRSLLFCSNKYLFSFPWKYSKRPLILTLCPYCITYNALNNIVAF